MDFAIECEMKRSGRFAIVLVALEQDRAVLDHQQPGDALVRQEIIERPGLVFEPVAELGVAAGRGQAAAADGALLSV